MPLKDDKKSTRNHPGDAKIDKSAVRTEDQKVEEAAKKIEAKANPITHAEADNGQPATEDVTETEEQCDEVSTDNAGGMEGAANQAEAAEDLEVSEGPSALKVPDALDVSQQYQNIITGKTTLAGAEVASEAPGDAANRPSAVDQSDSAAMGQGTTESYTTGQSDRHNDHTQTIDPLTGAGMTRGELRALEAERRTLSHEDSQS